MADRLAALSVLRYSCWLCRAAGRAGRARRRPPQQVADHLAAARLYRGRLSRGGARRAGSSTSSNIDEMVEFSDLVGQRLAALPAKPAARGADRRRQGAASGDRRQGRAGRDRRPGADARRRACSPLIRSRSPRRAPPTSRAAPRSMPRIAPPATAARAKGRAAAFAKLDPPPIAFADRDRARDRSLFGLYQVIIAGPRRHGDAKLRVTCPRRIAGRWPSTPATLAYRRRRARASASGATTRRSAQRSPTSPRSSR